MYKVAITDSGYKSYDIERQLVESIGGKLEIRHCLTEDEVIDFAHDADAVLVRQQPFTARVISKLEKCQVIARYGTGVDNVDIPAATENGIIVANVVAFGVHEVAEHAIALLFSCARKTVSHDKMVRAGAWDIAQRDPIHRIHGRTIGFVGFGQIAQAVARKLAGFELQVLAYDPYLPKEVADRLCARLVDMDTVLRESDYVLLHSPLTDQTRHMIDDTALAKMKPTAILVNTARGGLVDTEALYRALKSGTINSAGIDVHEAEPVPGNYSLFELDNAVITDHAGWYSEESMGNLQRGAAEAAAAVLSGGWPKSVVNPEVKERFAARFR